MEFRELNDQEFNEFTKIFPLKSIYQTQEYGLIMEQQKYTPLLLGLVDNSKVVGASLILVKKEEGFKYAYAPRGFILNYEDFYLIKDFTAHIKNYLGKKGIIGIKINPMIIRNIYDLNTQTKDTNPKYDLIFEALKQNGYYHLGYNNFFEALKPRFEAIIDLNKPLYELFKNVSKSYRTKIRSAIKNGIRTYRGNVNDLEYLHEFTKYRYPRGLDYFKDCFGFFLKRNMIDLYYTKLDTKIYLKTIQDKLASYENKSNQLNNLIMNKKTKYKHKLISKKINIDKYLNQYRNELISATNMLRNYPEGVVTSCILLVKQDKEITILMDGYAPNFKKLNSKHLLIWQIIEMHQKQGFTKFNLGGVSNITIDSNRYTGLDEFKLGFGAKMYEYAGDFELVTHKRNYNLYRNYVPLKKLIKSKLIK